MNATYYTDGLDVYRTVVPSPHHVIGKTHTVAIERDNRNTRHYLARFTRRSKVVSKKPARVDLTLRLHQFLRIPQNYALYQQQVLSIF